MNRVQQSWSLLELEHQPIAQSMIVDTPSEFRLGEWLVRPRLIRIERGGEIIQLPPKSMAVLQCLAAADGNVVSRNEILDAVWPKMIVTDDVLTQSVVELRKAFGDTARDSKYIETIPKVGFRLVAPVVTQLAEAAAEEPQIDLAHRPDWRSKPLQITAFITAVLITLGVFWYQTDTRQPERRPVVLIKDIESVAVLPFVNMSGDPDQEYFSDGATEEILNTLAVIDGLRVVGRTSSFAFKGKDVDVRTIGAQLGADSVLEGSIRKDGRRLRITAQLVSTVDGFRLWSDSYDRELGDIFKIQEEIAAAISDALKVELGLQVAKSVKRRSTENLDAYSSYLKARSIYRRAERHRYDEALELLERSIELDPDYSPIYPIYDAIIAATTEPPMVSGYTQLTRSQLIFPPAGSPLPLVIDASRIYFNDFVSGRFGFRQLSQTGGDAIKINSVFDQPDIVFFNPVTLTPDRSQFLLHAASMPSLDSATMWLLPVIGGDPRRLGDGFAGAYSPDGSQLLHTDGHDGIYLANTDLSGSEKLTTAPGKVYWPQFSPDGRRIRFTVARDHYTLWEIAADGTGLHAVFEEWDASSHCCGSWTPDGRYYVFEATLDYRTQLWAIRETDGRSDQGQPQPIQITTGALDFRRPTIADDGNKIFAIGWQLRGELVRYDSVSGRFVPMPEFTSLSAEWLVYSRDEQWIAYVSYPEADLWRSKRDGTSRLQLTLPPMRAVDPTWSPDGQTLAFLGRLPGERWRIYLVSADGGNLRAITQEIHPQSTPSWSPDGRSLAFSALGKDRIQILDLATETVVELEGSDGLLGPRWSPDGRYLATYSEGSLRLFDLTTGHVDELLKTDSPLAGGSWAADGESVYFHHPFYLPGKNFVYNVNIRDKAVEKAAAIGDMRVVWGIFGMWSGVTPDGSPILLRDLSIHHIYALDWQPD